MSTRTFVLAGLAVVLLSAAAGFGGGYAAGRISASTSRPSEECLMPSGGFARDDQGYPICYVVRRYTLEP